MPKSFRIFIIIGIIYTILLRAALGKWFDIKVQFPPNRVLFIMGHVDFWRRGQVQCLHGDSAYGSSILQSSPMVNYCLYYSSSCFYVQEFVRKIPQVSFLYKLYTFPEGKGVWILIGDGRGEKELRARHSELSSFSFRVQDLSTL